MSHFENLTQGLSEALSHTELVKEIEKLRAENEALRARVEKLERVKRLADNEMVEWNEDRCDHDNYDMLMQFREDLRTAIKACDEGEK